jgi:hypothetical protein
MNPGKYEPADGRDYQPDAFDRELDAALGGYANANPRTGLENRIVARIAAERNHVDVEIPWLWPVVAFVAISVVLAVAIQLNLSKPARHEIGPMALRLEVPQTLSPSGDVLRVKTANSTRSKPHRQTVARLPKLEQFPSPQPLSDQEKVLADYVARFRDEAVLVARVNAEELIRERTHMAEGAGNTDSTEIDQSEITNR